MTVVTGDLLSAAISKLADLNVRLDSIEAGVNARLDSRDQVVAAVADTIARLATRMDSFESRSDLYEAREAEPLEDDAPPGEDYRVGELAEGATALEDEEAAELPEPEYPEPIALEE